MSDPSLDRAGRRRSPATLPGFNAGRPPRNEGVRATRLELDGGLLVSLDDEGRCRDFREWSNRRELAPSRAIG